MSQPSSSARGPDGIRPVAGGGDSQQAPEIQHVKMLATRILQSNPAHPGAHPTLHLPEEFGRRVTRGDVVTKTLDTDKDVIEGVKALNQLIAKKFKIEGMLEDLNFQTGILVYYKKEECEIKRTPGESFKVVKKQGARPTTLNLSEMLFKKPFTEVGEIYDLGDAIFQTWASGKKAFILGCKALYQSNDTESFQGYSDFPQLYALISCDKQGAEEQVDKVLKDFKIVVNERKKADVIQKYALERALGSNPKEYNPGKILALLDQNPVELVETILSNKDIEKSVSRIPLLRDKGKVQQKIELRDKFIAECCGYSQNPDCQAFYHEYFRTHRPFPYRDNMGIIEHFEPLKRFSTNEQIKDKLERFERKEDFLEKFNKITSDAYRKKLQELVPPSSPDRLQNLYDLERRLRALELDLKDENKLKEQFDGLYTQFKRFQIGDLSIDLVNECGANRLTDELRIIAAQQDSIYEFGDKYLQIMECHLTKILLGSMKLFSDYTPQEIECYLNQLHKDTEKKEALRAEGTGVIDPYFAIWSGRGLKLKIRNEELANQVWIAIHASGFTPTNPSALSGWYQEFQSNPPENGGLSEFLSNKERDFQQKLDFVRSSLPPELSAINATGVGSGGAVRNSSVSGSVSGSVSSGGEKEKQYIALELQKNWDPLFSNQGACLEIYKRLEARKKEIEKILGSKKGTNSDQNRTLKIDKILEDISQIAIDSFKFDPTNLDQLVEDWIESEPPALIGESY